MHDILLAHSGVRYHICIIDFTILCSVVYGKNYLCSCFMIFSHCKAISSTVATGTIFCWNKLITETHIDIDSFHSIFLLPVTRNKKASMPVQHKQCTAESPCLSWMNWWNLPCHTCISISWCPNPSTKFIFSTLLYGIHFYIKLINPISIYSLQTT